MSVSNVLGTLPFDLISLLAGGIFTLFKSIKFIQEGEKGVKLRFGKAVRINDEPKIYEPGFTLLIPFVDTLKRHPVRQQTLPFNDQRIMLNNGMTFILAAFVLFKVTDVYKALFEISELEGSLEDLCTGALRDKVAKLSHNDLSDTEKIGNDILSLLKERTESWGIEVIDFRLTNCAPSPETANLLSVPAKITLLTQAATDLGTTLQKADPGLLSVLVGAPLVATTQNHDQQNYRYRGHAYKQRKGRLEAMLQHLRD